MKKLFVTASLIALHHIAVFVALACFVAPPDYEFLPAEDEEFFFRKDNINKVIEVRRSESLELVWKTEIKDLSTLFSRILVADDGSKVIRIKGNHEVNSLSDIAVEYYFQDGTIERFPASDFVSTLHKVRYPSSASPAHIWYSNFRYSKDSGLKIFPHSVTNESSAMPEGAKRSGFISPAILVAASVLATFLLTRSLTRRRSQA